MKASKSRKKSKNVVVPIEEIEKLALAGKDVNKHFRGGKMMRPLVGEVQRVNVDFGIMTIKDLDQIAVELNVSRQAVIKLFIQREMDQHFLAKQAREAQVG